MIKAIHLPDRRLFLVASFGFLAACGGDRQSGLKVENHSPVPTYSAEIRRTSFGIPHIKANDEAGLGYGIGYAYAQDNLCLLANEVLTVNGERSKYWGAEGPTSEFAGLSGINSSSDYFYKLVNDDAAVDKAWNAQTEEARALIRGYVAGVNQQLQEQSSASKSSECSDAPWLRAITERDIIKLMRRIAMANSSVPLLEGIVNAQPPSGKTMLGNPILAGSADKNMPLKLARITASNALAVGKSLSDNGRGLLLGQPHLPWGGMYRFYQLHLSMPGRMNVMGATLPGLPVVGIGYTEHFAWTHTTDTSAHMTAYALQLDRADPTRYIVDGKFIPMDRKTISIEVKGSDGKLVRQSRDFYQTRFGPVFILPEAGLMWNESAAYAIRDANADNHRVIEQWYRMNRASSLQDVQTANEQVVGNPWNYTIAADKNGNTLFLNISPIPGLDEKKLAACLSPEHAPLAASGLLVLAGQHTQCDWNNDPAAPQPGIIRGDRLPALHRGDYVHNSNDSAWLTHHAERVTGFSPVISLEDYAQGMRTRFGLAQVNSMLRGGRKIRPADLQQMALGNRVHLADLVMDDLLAWCGKPRGATADTPAIADGCTQLASWNRTADLDANIGYFYFAGMMERLVSYDGIWAHPFDPADPINTPRGLNYNDSAVTELLGEALAGAVDNAAKAGWTPAMKLGDIQASRRSGRAIPIHGGESALGVYNAIVSEPTRDGLLEAAMGTSYVQIVRFDEHGPDAQALLSYAQSSNPASPHFVDQTEQFSKKSWIKLPFSERQILSDPNYRTMFIAK